MTTQEALQQAKDALEAYADKKNWNHLGNGILRVWVEPGSTCGFERAEKALAALATVSEQPLTLKGVTDAEQIAEIWDAAKEHAAVYVENHCVDGEMHANAILSAARPTIRTFAEFTSPAPAVSSEAQPVAEIVGDTRFEGWLSENIASAGGYIKQDMRDAYWAGYKERDSLASPDQDARPNEKAILKAINANRDAWSREHGHTEHDTGVWVLNEIDQSYLEGMDAMIAVAQVVVPETSFGNMDVRPSGVVARQDPEALAAACAIAAYEASGATKAWTYLDPSQWPTWEKVASAVRGVLAGAASVPVSDPEILERAEQAFGRSRDFSNCFDAPSERGVITFVRSFLASQPAAPVQQEPVALILGQIADQAARFAIEAAIDHGRIGIYPPPSADHWLMPFWDIGQQLAAQPVDPLQELADEAQELDMGYGPNPCPTCGKEEQWLDGTPPSSGWFDTKATNPWTRKEYEIRLWWNGMSWRASPNSPAATFMYQDRKWRVPAELAAQPVQDKPQEVGQAREQFEAWAKREGGLNLRSAGDAYCEDFRFPATYYYAPTETAWRAWANKPAQAAPAVPEGWIPAEHGPKTGDLCVWVRTLDGNFFDKDVRLVRWPATEKNSECFTTGFLLPLGRTLAAAPPAPAKRLEVIDITPPAPEKRGLLRLLGVK